MPKKIHKIIRDELCNLLTLSDKSTIYISNLRSFPCSPRAVAFESCPSAQDLAHRRRWQVAGVRFRPQAGHTHGLLAPAVALALAIIATEVEAAAATIRVH